jgi:hypothetical protein
MMSKEKQNIFQQPRCARARTCVCVHVQTHQSVSEKSFFICFWHVNLFHSKECLQATVTLLLAERESVSERVRERECARESECESVCARVRVGF